MTTTVETPAPTTEAAPDEPTQYEYPEGWTFPSYDPATGEDLAPRVVFVNSVRAGNRDAWLNTFRHAEAGRGNDGWSVQGRRVYGAVVNPTLHDGRHYLVFGRFVVRYNDEFHTRQRHHSASPFSIVCAADGTPWHFPKDSIISLEGSDYITLNSSTVTEILSNLGQSGTEEPATPAVWEDGSETITFGFGRKEEDGTVLLNPDPEIGEVYILWAESAESDRDRHTCHLAVYTGGGAISDAFAISGYWYRYYSTPEFQQTNDWHSTPDRWIKMGFLSDYTEPYNTRTTAYVNATERSKTELETFNMATNKLAIQHSWCSEYESIITRLGMKSRYHGWWYLDVEATTCITREEVGGYNASDILASLGVSGRTITNLSLEAKITVRVSGVQADTEDEAKEKLTDELLSEALAKQFPSTTFAELREPTVVGVYEDRDSAIQHMRDGDDE